MSVAPAEYDDDVTVSDEHYARALEGQQSARARRFRLVSNDPAGEPLEVAVPPIEAAEQSELMAQLALRLLESVLRTTAGKTEVQHILTTAWPWAAHLPEHDIIAMVDELGTLLLKMDPSAARDAAALQLLIEWDYTAEIWADPELRERLRGPIELDGPVPIPGTRRRRHRCRPGRSHPGQSMPPLPA